MLYLRVRTFLFLAIAGLAAACGDNQKLNVTPDAAQPVVDAAPVIDAPADANPVCLAPMVITPDPNAEAAASAALQTLSPTATLAWSSERGTLTSISGLVVTLPSCTGTTNVIDQMFDVLDQSPALFQIDRTEWQGNVLQCADVLANGFHLVVIRRNKYGPYSIQHDVFSAVADVQNGQVILRNFSGAYLPPPSPAVLAVLQECPDLSQAALTPGLRAQPFLYERYALPPAEICTSDGDFTYTAKPNDTLTFDPSITVDWDASTTITLHRQASATLLVDPSNYTIDLMSSSANCADNNNTPHIGWIRTFNTVTGEILYDHATPDPYCTVCFH